MEKDYLLKKWLNDALTEAEQKEFEAMEGFDLDQRILKEAGRFKASHFSSAKDFSEIESQLSAPKKVKRLERLKPLMALTGALVVGLGIYFMFFLNPMIEINTLAAEKVHVELPDTSEVTLNALSSISYSENDWDKIRSLQLVGEAYFKVAKGKTFDVTTPEGTVTVVGTQFNVKQRGNFFEVICFEGIVKVTSGLYTEQLTAGSSFRIDNGSLQLIKTLETFPSWTENKSNFKAVTFAEVISEMERQYNITISYPEVKSTEIFTGGFVHDDLENALKSITKPLNLTYNIESSNQVRLLLSE